VLSYLLYSAQNKYLRDLKHNGTNGTDQDGWKLNLWRKISWAERVGFGEIIEERATNRFARSILKQLREAYPDWPESDLMREGYARWQGLGQREKVKHIKKVHANQMRNQDDDVDSVWMALNLSERALLRQQNPGISARNITRKLGKKFTELSQDERNEYKLREEDVIASIYFCENNQLPLERTPMSRESKSLAVQTYRSDLHFLKPDDIEALRQRALVYATNTLRSWERNDLRLQNLHKTYPRVASSILQRAARSLRDSPQDVKDAVYTIHLEMWRNLSRSDVEQMENDLYLRAVSEVMREEGKINLSVAEAVASAKHLWETFDIFEKQRMYKRISLMFRSQVGGEAVLDRDLRSYILFSLQVFLNDPEYRRHFQRLCEEELRSSNKSAGGTSDFPLLSTSSKTQEGQEPASLEGQAAKQNDHPIDFTNVTDIMMRWWDNVGISVRCLVCGAAEELLYASYKEYMKSATMNSQRPCSEEDLFVYFHTLPTRPLPQIIAKNLSPERKLSRNDLMDSVLSRFGVSKGDE